VPTVYPKCAPTEMLGLLVLLESHKGDQEIARLADDLDLEIDEILPAIDFAQVLGFVKLGDGRAVLTESGKRLMAGSINARKEGIREQLIRTTLFKALTRALENSPEHRLTEEQVIRLISFTTAPADELVQNIINWGRYAGMFRYDPDQHLLLPTRVRSGRTASPSRRSPPVGPTDSESRASEAASTPAARMGSDELAPFASMAS
jgi:hypothetical protein